MPVLPIQTDIPAQAGDNSLVSEKVNQPQTVDDRRQKDRNHGDIAEKCFTLSYWFWSARRHTESPEAFRKPPPHRTQRQCVFNRDRQG
jgi:hypothetical protein